MTIGPDAVDAIITGVAGLAGAVLGAVVAYLSAARAARATVEAGRQQVRAAFDMARDQARASLIGTSRQQWIDGLREEVAELLTALFRLELALGEQNEAGRQKFESVLSEVICLEAKIAMRINPDTPTEEESELLLAVNQGVVRLRRGKGDPAQLRSDITGITESARRLLKREWERQWDLVGGKRTLVTHG